MDTIKSTYDPDPEVRRQLVLEAKLAKWREGRHHPQGCQFPEDHNPRKEQDND